MVKMSVVPAVAALILLGAQAGPALALSGASGPDPRAEVTVVGHGRVQATPDVMRLNVGVEVRGARAGVAFAAVKRAAARLTRALVAAGVPAADLRTSDLALGAEYDRPPRVIGYRASVGIETVVRDLSKADAVIDAVAAVGEEARLHGISFEFSRPETLMRQARDEAYGDALGKARQYARLTGRRLGRVAKLEEEGDAPLPRFAAMESSISPGRGSVSVTVRVVYELG